MSNGKINTPLGQQKVSPMSLIPPQAWFYIIGIPVVVGVGYFALYKPLMKKLGIMQSLEEKELEKINEDVEKQPFWAPTYYKNHGGATINNAESSAFAKTLYDATDGGWTGWGTDEDAIYGVFRVLGSKGNISKVSEAYFIKYNDDLLANLKDELNTEDFGQVSQIISTYLTATKT